MTNVDRIDRYQRSHRWLGLPIAVVYKFFDDQGPYLAALLTYYGFVSLFPLLLLFFTILGYVASGDPALQRRLVDSALVDFPVIGAQLRDNVHAYTGNGTALVAGIVGTLYGGTGVMQAAQNAFNRIYAVPRNERPNPIKSRLRSLGLLGLLGTGVLITSALSALVSTANSVSDLLSGWLLAVFVALTIAVNIALFVAAYRLLVGIRLHTREVLVGGVVAALAWEALQTAGTAYLSTRLDHARELYGTFALVLGTLAWIYLEALVVVFCAELNVVLHHRIWPRALLTPFTDNVDLTAADERAYTTYAESERLKGFQRVAVWFERHHRGRSP